MTDFLSSFLNKEASLAGKVEDKERNLNINHSDPTKSSINPNIESTIYDLGRILDGDTLSSARKYGEDYTDFRLGSLESGYSLDTPEVYKSPNHSFWKDPKNVERVEKDREVLSKILGREASVDEVFQWGQQATNKLEEALFKDQVNYSEEGPIRPKIEVKPTGVIDKYGREVTEVFNPVTGESLTKALNDKLTNVGYYTGYNQAKVNEDIAANIPVGYNNDSAAQEFKNI
jgi:hypothetical protein